MGLPVPSALMTIGSSVVPLWDHDDVWLPAGCDQCKIVNRFRRSKYRVTQRRITSRGCVAVLTVLTLTTEYSRMGTHVH